LPPPPYFAGHVGGGGTPGKPSSIQREFASLPSPSAAHPAIHFILPNTLEGKYYFHKEIYYEEKFALPLIKTCFHYLIGMFAQSIALNFQNQRICHAMVILQT